MKRTIFCALIALSSTLFAADSQSLTAEQARADLAALYQGLQEAHYDLFAHRSKAEYEAKYTQVRQQLSQAMTPFELFVELQKFAAFGNVAHAKVEPPANAYGQYRESGGTALPIYPRIIDSRVYVSEDYSGLDSIQAGDEILAIDGQAIDQWLARLRQHISADTDYIAHSILESAFPVYLWIEAGSQASYELTLRSVDGTESKVRVSTLKRSDLMSQIDAAPKQFSLDFSDRQARMLNNDVAYLRPGPFYNVENPDALYEPSAFVAFIDSAFQGFINDGADSLIIDLRANPGGNNTFSDPIVQWIADRPFRFASKFLVRSSDQAAASNQARIDGDPAAANGVSGRYAKAFAETPRGETFEFEVDMVAPHTDKRFEGEVYVLVNRTSYSNAVTTAAIFKDYGWATIAGEPTADYATTYGAMEHFTLPESGLRVGFPKALIVRPNGDQEVGGVMPDITIRAPVAVTEKDLMLEGLLDYIEKQ